MTFLMVMPNLKTRYETLRHESVLKKRFNSNAAGLLFSADKAVESSRTC
jgi:hypothetical protein